MEYQFGEVTTATEETIHNGLLAMMDEFNRSLSLEELVRHAEDIKRQIERGDRTLLVCGCGAQDLKPMTLIRLQAEIRRRSGGASPNWLSDEEAAK